MKLQLTRRGALQFILLLAAGVFLCWLSFRKLDTERLWTVLRSGNYVVCIPVFMVSVTGYWFRVKRWQLMLNAAKAPARTSGLFISLCVGYLVSYVLPRFGEVVRCLIVKRTDDVPFERSLLSILLERVVDVIVLLVLLAAAFLVNISNTSAFFLDNVINPLLGMLNPLRIGLIVAAGLLALWLLNRFLMRMQRSGSLAGKWDGLKESLLLMIRLPQKGLFLFYTIAIWGCYYLMTYLWLFTFAESRSVDATAAFVIMVIGSIGRSIPIQGGGIGAYHFLVSRAFALFGLSLEVGNALALVIHGAQSVFTFLTGFLCSIWLPFKLKARNSQP